MKINKYNKKICCMQCLRPVMHNVLAIWILCWNGIMQCMRAHCIVYFRLHDGRLRYGFHSIDFIHWMLCSVRFSKQISNEMIIVCNWAIVCILFNYIGFVWTLNSHFQPSTSFPYAQFSVHESVNSLRTYVSQSVLACDEIDYFFLSFDKWVVSTHALKYCVMHKHSDINLNYVRLYVQFGARSVNRNETDRWNERQTNETEIESTISRKWKKLLF